MHAPTGLVAEKKAYKELTSYLINLGKYPDAELADIDAQQRVNHFEQLNLYTSDPQLRNASILKKKTHALIYGHELHDVIVANDGYLPDVK
jgi:hypothetical protein